ncbi:MAG TPA: rhomboid family intramembrane serine protease [Cytophagaceae bacterium]|jgi:membrane associated rhomboid family serine protease|nr:rhomboid family intramembrane serine protease [Cytophagaceae bacterium]
MRITYNAPFTLTLTLVCTIIRFLGDSFTNKFFVVGGSMNFADPLDYIRLFSHALGHGDWHHLLANFSLILILGPILEEKYGTASLAFMSFMTALITGILNILLFDTGLMGASGLVFMMILLASFTNFTSGTIPLTFILVLVFYVGNELYSIFKEDNISQFAHILGGLIGSVFGFKGKRE